MKRTYIQPDTNSHMICLNSIICGSLNITGNTDLQMGGSTTTVIPM